MISLLNVSLYTTCLYLILQNVSIQMCIENEFNLEERRLTGHERQMQIIYSIV